MFTSNLNTVLDRLMMVSQGMEDASLRSADAPTEGRQRAQLWLPPVDIYETDNAFVVEADLPGVHQENVDIQFDRSTLTISGTRAATLPSREQHAQLRVFSAERLSGGFSRSVRLPEHVNPDGIEAIVADGVLRVTVPKSSVALPRKITVRSSTANPTVQG